MMIRDLCGNDCVDMELIRRPIPSTETHGGGAEAVPPLRQTPDAQERVDEDAEGAAPLFRRPRDVGPRADAARVGCV